MKSRQPGDHHPLSHLFRTLVDRAFTQTSLRDRDLWLYLSSLLWRFLEIDSLYSLKNKDGSRAEYLVDMLSAARAAPRGQKKEHFRQLGDYSLFILGMFPESLQKGKRAIPESYYQDTGRRSYLVASRLEQDREHTVVFEKLARQFGPCVHSLHWIRRYTTDPFYQYMFRQFGVG